MKIPFLASPLAENGLRPLSQSIAAQSIERHSQQQEESKRNGSSMGMEQFLRMTAVQAEAAMKPTLVGGKWKQPLISGRKVALIKKHAVRNGLVGQWVEGQGGWLETWGRAEKHHVMRPPKGHLNQRNEFDRCVFIFAILLWSSLPL